jgi:AcrR family transcriptional regulator
VEQLPSGRHGLSRRFVVANQRQRIVDALVHIVGAYGYQAASVERVAAHAGVSRRTFYEQFEGKEDAFVRAYDGAASQLLARVQAAAATGSTVSEQLHDGLAALLDGLAGEPQLAHMCVVAVLSAGPVAIDRRDAHMHSFARLVEDVARRNGGGQLPPLMAEGVVGAIYDIVYKRIAAGQANQLPGLLPDLHAFCMLLLGHTTELRPR